MGLYSSKPKSKFVVFLEGNIGVGKSTALRALEKEGYITVTEPIERWIDFKGINFLDLYSKNMTKWAFTFQTMALFTLWKKQREALKSPARIIIMERSVHSVIKMFAANQVKSGFISQEQYVLLSEMSQSWAELKERKEAFIYLRGSPLLAYQRSQSRGRQEESEIPLEYFQDLHEALENWIPMEKNVKVVDASAAPEAVCQRILQVVSQLE